MDLLDETMIRLECVRMASNDIRYAKQIFDFVMGVAEPVTGSSTGLQTNVVQPEPTYYVRNLDSSFTVADPQPV